MPKNAATNITSRLQTILKVLPPEGHAGLSVDDLVGKLTDAGYVGTNGSLKDSEHLAAKRKVQHDLKRLRVLKQVVSDDARTPRYNKIKGTKFDLLTLTPKEALALRLLQRTHGALLPPPLVEELNESFDQAAGKYAAERGRSRLFAWLDKVATADPTQPQFPQWFDSRVLPVIAKALYDDMTVEVDYLVASRRSEGLRRRVFHPLGIVQRGNLLYLVAERDEKPGEVGAFPMHRMRNAACTYNAVRRPAGFDLHSFIAQGGMLFPAERGLIHVEAWVSRRYGEGLREVRLAETQTLEKAPGGFLLRAAVLNTLQLKWWILSKGADIEVLAPKELRESISETLATAAGLYQRNPTPAA